MTKISTEKREKHFHLPLTRPFAFTSRRSMRNTPIRSRRAIVTNVYIVTGRERFSHFFSRCSWPRMNAAHVFRREIENISYDSTRPDPTERRGQPAVCPVRFVDRDHPSPPRPLRFRPSFSFSFLPLRSFLFFLLSRLVIFFFPPFGLRARTSRRSRKSGDVCRV